MNSTVIDSLAIFGASYLYIVLLFIALVWFLFQTRAAKLEMISWGIVALPVMYILLIIAGVVYYNARPFDVGHFTPLIPHSPDNGFPSDHTLLCSATSSIVFFYNKKMSAVLWASTALVGASRVYTGLHHATDITASVLLATIVGYLTWAFVVPELKRTGVYAKVLGIIAARHR
jgi:undecaprenyl-diphosphatase